MSLFSDYKYYFTLTIFATLSLPVKRLIFLVANSTTPSLSEIIVSSAVRLVFFPARNTVPLWRIIISPFPTDCPPKTFTPSLLEIESRPNLVDPPAFLVAILDKTTKPIDSLIAKGSV